MLKWISENLFWIVPSLISAATIVFVVVNTNKQIRNQNKESHRPYLKFFDINDCNEDFFNSYIAVKNNEGKNTEEKTVYTKIEIKNVGYGIATNIHLLGFANTVISKAGIEEKRETGKLFSVLDIGSSEESIIKITLASNENSTNTTYDLMLFYTDLNKNIYSTMLLIEVNKNELWNLYYYPNGTLNFDDIIKKRSVKYKALKRKYIKWKLGKS